MKETDLGKAVVDWLVDQHWDVYQEVQFSPQSAVADIVAVRHGYMWAIECKISYGLAVLQQASGWWDMHYRSIAIPCSKEPRDYRVAVNYYNVGILEVAIGWDEKPYVREFCRPSLVIHGKDTIAINRARINLAKLTPLHKTFAQAGSNHHDHLTPYKQTMMDVRKVIEQNPGCTIRFLYEQLGEMHYSSKASFMGNLIKSLNDFEMDWCRIDISSKPYKFFIVDKDGQP